MDWDADYEEHYDRLNWEHLELIGDGEYTGRPILDSSTRVGVTHHPDCLYGEGPDATFDCCTSLWEADYQAMQEREAEGLHEEWWQ